jgi:predicted metal-dependent phosphoesterase TrpH
MGLADIHLHTTASDGMMSPAMLLNYVSALTSLDLVVITDHNTQDGYLRAREFKERRENDHLHELTLIPGIEVSSRDGHILGLNVPCVIPRGLSAAETVDAIHAAGGLACAPHPYAWLPGLRDFAGVGRRFLTLPFDAVETRNSTPTETLHNFVVHRDNRRRQPPIAECGGSDGHFLWAVGRTWTEYEGRGWDDLARSIRARRTRARGMTWGPVSLFRYFVDKRLWRRFCAEHHVLLHDL